MTAPALTIERWPIDRPQPFPGNPKSHDVDAIRASMQQNGVYRPITVQASTGYILAGHGTLEALRAEGAEELDVVLHDCDDNAARRIVAGDNEIPNLAGVDDRLLAELLQPIADDLLGSGHTDNGLADLLASLDPDPADDEPRTKSSRRKRKADPDDIPERAVGRSKTGDLWLIGEHRILVGDSTVPEDLDRLLDGAKADLIVTDPPYAIYGSSTGIAADIADDKMVRPFFEQLLRTAAGRVDWFAHVYVNTDWRSYAAIWDSAGRAGLSVKNCIVWDKGGAGLGSSYANTHEFIAFLAKLPPHGSMTSSRRTGQRMVHRSNVMRYDRPRGAERHHNAAKPVALLAELINNSSDPGELVLDMFCGSGSTVAAAHSVGRRGYAIEIDPHTADIAVARLEAFVGVTAELAPAPPAPNLAELAQAATATDSTTTEATDGTEPATTPETSKDTDTTPTETP